MVGVGYVGLVSSACFSEFGVEVVCMDRDLTKITRLRDGEMPIYEPGLDTLVASNVTAGRLSFTTDLEEAVIGSDAVFIAVGTPSRRGGGHADLSAVYQAAEDIARAMDESYTVVVTKSTVPVGTGREVQRIVGRYRPAEAFDVASNPEFLREGSAIDDFMRPDRVIIGGDGERASDVLRTLYRPLFLLETPIIFTGLETAELIKYAANTFLATKITFINEIADLCEKLGADVQDVARGIGLDGRIGRKFLHAGPGYGGSCFPKDTLALVSTARQAGAPVRIVETVVAVNDARKRRMIEKIVAACDGSVTGKTIAVLGLTFKPNTDDMRDSPSLDILPGLTARGARVRAFDPQGMNGARPLFNGIEWCDDAYSTPWTDADCLAIITEWNEFRALDLRRAKSLLKSPGHGRFAQHLPPRGSAGGGLRLSQHRARDGQGSRMTMAAIASGAEPLDPTILRAYDIRGVVGRTLRVKDARAIGRAFGTWIGRRGGRRICVGFDGRLSSPKLEAALVEGLILAGAQVIRVGLGPTPMLYFAVNELSADAGVMVSGSHNPPEYNGFKLTTGDGPFFGADILALGRMIAESAFASGRGGCEDTPVLEAYVDRLVEDYRPGDRELHGRLGRRQRMRPATAMEMLCAPPARRAHRLLNERIDGTFPSHHPDPDHAREPESSCRSWWRKRNPATSASRSTATATASG